MWKSSGIYVLYMFLVAESIMTYEEIFEEVKEKFKDADVSGIDEHLAFQFNITGEGEIGRAHV